LLQQLLSLIDNKVISTLVFLFVVFALRWLVVYLLKKQPEQDDEGITKRWINATSNVTWMVIFFGLLIIWLSELRFIALSIAAFGVAIVLAMKEFIMCLVGHVYLAITSPFRVGDWISAGNTSGEVISNDWLSTYLLEVDVAGETYDYTGKTVVIPNSQFLTLTVKNLNHVQRYVDHTFSLVCDPAKYQKIEVSKLCELILQQARICCEDFYEVAKRYNHLIEKRLGVTLQGAEASVRVSTTEVGNYLFAITLFCPTAQATEIQQKLTLLVLENLPLKVS